MYKQVDGLRLGIGKIVDKEFEYNRNILNLNMGDTIILSGVNSDIILSLIVSNLMEINCKFILIDSSGLYQYFSSGQIKKYIIGWNLALPLEIIEKHIGEKNILFDIYTNIFSILLNMDSYERIILQNILLKILTKRSNLIEDLRSELESLLYLSTYSIRKNFIEKFLSILDIFTHSFISVTFPLQGQIGRFNETCIFDYSLIPSSFRNLALLLNLILLEKCDYPVIIIDLNGIYERNILIKNELFRKILNEFCKREDHIIIVSDKNLSFLLKLWSTSIRNLILTQIHDLDDINILFKMGFSRDLLLKLLLLESDRALILDTHNIYETRINIESFKYLKNIPKKFPKKTLKYPGYLPKIFLSNIFGRNAEIIYSLLSFLREGATNRDGVLSYLQYKYGLKTSIASQLMVKAMIYNLIEEVVGKDGRYWIRITLKGISVMEEYEKYMGGLK